MAITDFPKGTRVRFLPGPASKSPVEATVTGHAGVFLTTEDGDGYQRKDRPGACTKI